MQAYQQRVIEEKQELDAKLDKLNQFIDSPQFLVIDGEEQKRLRLQRTFMLAYSNVLGERIEAFK
jgi:hypothetical protein